MGGHFAPAGVREVEAVLKYLGFAARKQGSTSHINWVKDVGKQGYRRVTVDANNAPFKDQSLKWMLDQIGVPKKEFYRILVSLR